MRVYTSIFGNYDSLRRKAYFSDEVEPLEHICFSDCPIDAPDWNVIVGDPPIEGTPRMRAKWFKLHSHLLFPNENSLYMDGNYRLTRNPDYLDSYITEGVRGMSSDLILFRHYANSLKQEFERCLEKLQRGPQTCEAIRGQRDAYEKYHDLENLTLYQGSALVRGPGAKSFNEMWWEHINKYSMRDQLSLALVAHITKINYSVFPGPSLDTSCIVQKMSKHNGAETGTRDKFL